MQKQTRNNRQKMRTALNGYLMIASLILLILVGFSLIAIYQTQTAVREQDVRQEVQTFSELVSVYKTEEIPIDEPDDPAPMHHEELYKAMQVYNEEIYRTGQCELVDDWSYQAAVFDLNSYSYTLDAIGVIKIPDIDVEMPLYLGATYDNLAKGLAQFSQTSMPIGGENTNCVIAGHRGWDGMAYLRDVELLEIGDPVYIQNPWEILEYRISEVLLIEPDDMKYIYIQPGRDMLTIVTCHPYGVGSHRYVLICDRYYEEDIITATPTEGYWTWELQTKVNVSASEDIQFESSQLDIIIVKYLPWICAILAAASVSLLLLIIHGIKKILSKRKAGKYSASKKHRL